MTTSPFMIWMRGQFPALVVAFVVLAAAGAVKWQAGLMPENTAVPTLAMPSPNARDTFTAADALLRYKDAVGYAVSEPETAPPGTPKSETANWTSRYHVFTLAEKDKIVAENLPAISKLHQGFPYPYMTPQARSFGTLFPYYAPDRAMARLLSLTGQTRAAHGDWGGAMDAYLDSVELGSDLPHGGPVIGMLVGVACELIGRKPAYAAIDHLTASQAKMAARRLLRIDVGEEAPAQTIQEEEWFTQGSLLDLFRQHNWRAEMLLLSGETDDSGRPTTSIATKFQFQMESPRAAYDNYSRYMDAIIANARLPWPQARLGKQPMQPTDPVSQVLLPIFAKATLKQVANLAMDRLLEAQLALQAYRMDHGRYPAELADLVPAYLPAVPLDPFSDSKTLRYRLSRSGYLLYSIGPDTVDNGGQAIVDRHNAKDHDYYYQDEDAAGDIVAGLNYP